MPGPFLTTASKIMCPHGGMARLATHNSTTSAGAARILVETDVHDVLPGCLFTVGPKKQPCKSIRWKAGATNVTISGAKALVTSSIGSCYSAEGAFQGIALVLLTQLKATGL